MAAARGGLLALLLLLPFATQASAQGCSVSDSRPSVNENNPPGYVVATIRVEPGFTVRIDPASPDARFFAIEGSELQLNQPVDYEEDTLLLVSLLCQDGAGQSDALQVIVTIINLNDNSPAFPQTSLSRAVPEDTRVNATVVAREDLSASDADLDTIYYELRTAAPGAAGYFAIKGVNNPELYLQRALDYEKFNETTLLLYARDRPVGDAEETHTATATINLRIEQADTRPPWFLPCSFVNSDKSVCISSPYTGRVNISEMSREPLALEPGPIFAVDPDYMLNERIVYSLVGGDADGVFSVDADSGNLTMNKAATAPASYLLQVMATQVNNIQKYSVVSVEIQVINKSHFAPYFERSSYSGAVAAGLAPGSFVLQAEQPSAPLRIRAADDDFPDKFNPNIEYSIENSSDFTATRDGLILTSSTLRSPGTVTLKAVGKDTVSLQEASAVVVVEVLLATDASSAEKTHTARDMALLGGTLAALLLLALVLLGVTLCKRYGKPLRSLVRDKFPVQSLGGYENHSYRHDELPGLGTTQPEMSEKPPLQTLEQPLPALAPSEAEETHGLPKASVASSIGFGQEEEEEEVEAEEKPERGKEVKSILRTDRPAADDGYKAVWFETDVDPEAGERVAVIDAADSDDGSDRDLQKSDDDEDDDDPPRGPGASRASEGSLLPPAAVAVSMPAGDAGSRPEDITAM